MGRNRFVHVAVGRRILGTSAGLAMAAGLWSAGASAAATTIVWGSADIPAAAAGKDIPAGWWDQVVQQFETEHPDIVVQPIHEDWNKIAVQTAAGSAPDVIDGCCSWFHEMGVAGQFLDLTPYIGTVLPDYQAHQDYWPLQYGAFSSAGKQWGLPKYLGTIALYYNRELFANAGLTPPSADLAQNHMDWNQFEDVCKKLTKVDASGKTTQYGFAKVTFATDQFSDWFLAGGASFYVDGDPGRSALDSPAAVDTLTFLQRLKYQDGCASNDWNAYNSGFNQGKVGMKESGNWSLGGLLDPKVNLDWALMPLPIGPSGKRATLATIDGYAIPKTTKHVQAALQFLDFLSSPYTSTLLAKNGLQPARREVVPQYLDLVKSQSPRATGVNLHVFTDAGAYAYPQYLYTDQGQADKIMGAAFSAIFDKQAAVKGTWTKAIEQLNNVLAGATKK